MDIFFYKHVLHEWRMRNDPLCKRAFMCRIWRAMLFLCAATAVLSISFVIWTLFMPLVIGGSAGGSGGGPETVETISREQLKNVLGSFEQRALRFNELSKKPPTISDPSK